MPQDHWQVLSRQLDDCELVFKFFVFFSRFEYALKRAAFLRATQELAEVDWDKYANSIRGAFSNVEDKALRDALGYLTRQPPRTQVQREGGLQWRDTVRGDGQTFERYILRLVATVRNNLFHGGKYPYPAEPVLDPARNCDLLRACLVILQFCLSVSPTVEVAFRETA